MPHLYRIGSRIALTLCLAWASTACDIPVASEVQKTAAPAQPEANQAPAAAEANEPNTAPTPVAAQSYFPPGTRYAELRAQVPKPTALRFDMQTTHPDEPPKELFELVAYDSALGRLPAYVSPPRSGPRRPAMLWIHGGFNWGIGALAWQVAERSNDQTAAAFREAGMVLMLPSLRGTNLNPGGMECFLGEVDDILAAHAYLKQRPDIDPDRIYLGGHSTGATLALLAAGTGAQFAGVFALGPVEDPRTYGDASCIPEGLEGPEVEARAPINFIDQIRSSTFVIEGEFGNSPSLQTLKARAGEAPVRFVEIPNANHFEIIRPVSELIARHLVAHATTEITAAAIAGAMRDSN